MRGFIFSSNFTKLYVTGDNGGTDDVIYEYDVDCAGTIMYVIRSDATDGNTVAIEQFSLSTAWDTSTISWTARTALQTGCTPSLQTRGVDFKPDGTRIFIGNEGNDIIAQYDLTTPWDVTSMTNQQCSPSIKSDEDKLRNIQLSSDGKFLYVGGNDGDEINKYSLTTPYNITSISLETSYSISAQTGDMRGFIFSSNFTKLYVTGDLSLIHI